MDCESGYFLDDYPYFKTGNGKETLVVFPPTAELRVSLIKDPMGQAKLMRKFIPEDYTLYMIGYKHNLTKEHTYEGFAKDFSMIIKENIGPSTIVGISYGGMTAIPFAAMYPELTKKLILIVTAHKAAPTGIDFMKESISLAELGDQFALDLKFTSLYKRKWIRIIMRILHRINKKKTKLLQNPLSTFINAYNHMILTNGENSKYLNKISAPTLIIGGSKDIFFTPEIYREASNEISNAKLVLYDNEYHMVPVERLKEVRKEVQNFLK